MERREFLNKVQQYKNAIDVYSGSDPLKPRYEYIIWLEKYAGKENSDVNVVLEQTLQKFQNDTRYSNDTRFVELLILFTRLKGHKLSYFQKLYEAQLGLKCSIFYKAWSDEFISHYKYIEAYKVIKKGWHANAQPLEILAKAERDLEAVVGKKILSGMTSCNLFKIPCECNVKVNQEEPVAVKNWEMNPLKPGEVDNFTCPLVIPEEDDPNKVRMYCKNLIYSSPGKEYQFEEIQMRKYYEKLRQLEASSNSTAPPTGVEPMMVSPAAKLDGHNPVQTPQVHISPPKHIQQVGGDTSVEAASFTAHTNFAFNLVKGMWDSPQPSDEKEEFKVPEAPKSVGKPIPSQFAIYNDSVLNEPENAGISRPFGAITAGSASQSKPGLGLSERKLTGPSGSGSSDRMLGGGVKQLMFGGNVRRDNDIEIDDDLATCLDGQTVAASNLKLPTSKEWNFEDLTCTTKVFNNFVSIASTPNMKNKENALTSNTPQSENYGSNVQTTHKSEDRVLSVILEASKETPGSGINSCNENKPPGIIEVERSLEQLDLANISNPFDTKLTETLLKSVNYPMNFDEKILQNYNILNTRLPNINKTLKLGETVYSLTGDSFKGAYAKVFRVTCNDNIYALKIEKPSCHWEYYICKEIRKRVDPQNVRYFGDINYAYFYSSGSIFVSDFARYGTLLNVINQYKLSSSKLLDSSVSTFFCHEVLSAVHYLNTQCNIIHADIKPDNFVVHSLPNQGGGPYLQLIDFGRSIDMRLLPKGSKFTCVVTTDGFQCNEMKENKPWTYQTDLYGLAGTIYCVLVGEYMKVIKKKDIYVLSRPLPRLQQSLWNPIFSNLLNIESCDSIPDLSEIKQVVGSHYNNYDQFTVRNSFNALCNILNGN